MTMRRQEFEDSNAPAGAVRRLRLLIGLVALSALGGPMLWAQDVGSSPTETVRIVSDAASLVPQLHKNISLKLSGVSVERALREIGKRADVPITYNDAILPKSSSVWLSRDDIRTDEALEIVLKSSGLCRSP